MAKAYQCDVCGKLFTKEELPVVQYQDFFLVSHNGNIIADVCETCNDALQEWIKSRWKAGKHEEICDNDCEHCDWATCPKMEVEE